jgi:hypothetical protein
MINLLNVAKFYKNLPHQNQALEKLQTALMSVAPELLNDDADWVKLWRSTPQKNNLLPDWQGGDKWQTVRAICKECDRQKLELIQQKAYLLATVEWETAGTFAPVREAYWLSEEWRRRNLTRYYPYYGRGYVQLTWDFNYAHYGELLGLDLLTNPDLALRPDIALFILIHGSKFGVFTGHRLENYVNSGHCDYWNARRVINGTDRATEIEAIAQDWEQWLKGQTK